MFGRLRWVPAGGLFHGVKADHVAFSVVDEGDVAVVADGEFGFVDFTSIVGGVLGFGGTVVGVEVNDGSTHARFDAPHMDEGAGTARGIVVHGEGPHFDDRTGEFGKLDFENGFVKFFGAIHVLHVDLKPADNVVVAHNV